MSDRVNSVEVLSERAGMRDNVAVIDLTNIFILANKLVESFVEQLIVFGEMNMQGVLVADAAAARGLDIPGVDAQRSGRTARASADGSRALTLLMFALFFFFQEKSKKNWFQRNAELVQLVIDLDDSEEERFTMNSNFGFSSDSNWGSSSNSKLEEKWVQMKREDEESNEEDEAWRNSKNIAVTMVAAMVYKDEYLGELNQEDLDRLLRKAEDRGFLIKHLNLTTTSTVVSTIWGMGYYLANGIYPKWATIVQTISNPRNDAEKLFTLHQEAYQKMLRELSIFYKHGGRSTNWQEGGPKIGWMAGLGQPVSSLALSDSMRPTNPLA
ncbi:DEAD-box ATP-dependent RNA helicase 13-like [Pyrus ussuriensis x Pyrus communis]|uniref:DEAD-box ATP-dependent RNA helicase 13-like n=1 Tax=Pyrus ussuriensis x Pyrus communis TaxID=2448454 RepID=A0A5N5GA55_9ROSA|nr:DEAD-box ATP-dependent RNA helicase 13-like [Pyrus ussuriensis x Pyrus communis]